MPDSKSNSVVKQAEDYYDSGDADNFYYQIWGGTDIHVGIYQSPSEPIAEASARTVETMAERLKHRPPGTRMLDIGAGYGGSARMVAKRLGFRVTCLNLSEVQNNRNRQMNEEAGLSDKVKVVYGNFEDLPFEVEEFDVVWSQDAILHSGMRSKVFLEVDRVLQPGGDFIFTDPMQKEGVAAHDLQPVLDRIHLDSMGSVETYKKYAENRQWKLVDVLEMPEQLLRHYTRVREELRRQREQLAKVCSQEYLDRMEAGLGHWIDAGKKGLLNWGILHFKKDQ